MVYILLKAGANPKITNKAGVSSLASISYYFHPRPTTIALLKQAPESEKTSLLVKAREILTFSRNTVPPPYLQRVL